MKSVNALFIIVLAGVLVIQFALPIPLLSGMLSDAYLAFFVPIIGFMRVVLINSLILGIAYLQISQIFMAAIAEVGPFWSFAIVGVFAGFAIGIIALTIMSYVLSFIYGKIILKKWFKALRGLVNN
jgi:hypothetical protein